MKEVQNIVERIEHLIIAKGMSTNAISKDAGVKSYAMDNMKRGRMPSVETLCGIADYFNVSVDYLLGRILVPENIATEANNNSGVVKQTIASVIVENNSDNLSAQERDML